MTTCRTPARAPLLTPLLFALLAVLAMAPGLAAAIPIEPARDDQVIETLPATGSARNDERRLRRELAARPRDA